MKCTLLVIPTKIFTLFGYIRLVDSKINIHTIYNSDVKNM